jgi:uncharacterized FlaG/YvyC family protein
MAEPVEPTIVIANQQVRANAAPKIDDRRALENQRPVDVVRAEKSTVSELDEVDLELTSRNLKALGSVKLRITVDSNGNEPIIKVLSRDTGDELLQIPAEHSLQITKTVKILAGMIFNLKA